MGYGKSWLRVGQAALTGTLCAMMVVPPAVVAEGGEGIPAESHASPLTRQERVLHALNRFTFGARPGDVDAVERMGVERWFEMQLHPGRIDDAAFEEELGRYPAMRLADAELMRRFPSGAVIRRMSNADLPLPGDPVEHAIYADAEAAYEAKLKKDAAVGGAADAAANKSIGNPTHDGGTVMNGAPGVVGDSKIVGEPTHDDGAVMNGAPGSVAGEEMTVGGKGGKARLRSVVDPMEEADAEAVLELGPEERMERLVAMSPEEMLSFRVAIRPRDRVVLAAGLTPEQMETVEALLTGPERVVAEEAMETRLMRDVDSQRQLQAVMTEFWLNHFNVYLRKNEQEPYMLAEYEREAILPHALGKFEDLLVATAKSPAMLMYLDNWESVGPDSVAASYADGGRLRSYADGGRLRVVGAQAGVAGPTHDDGTVMNGAPGVVAGQRLRRKLPKGINENYGRELMELHTLGVGGGYTQKDVIEVAKCFTGWTVDRPYGGQGMGAARMKRVDDGTPGEFVFEPNRHEPGVKVVLGHRIGEGGMKEGLEVLHILATSPATAHFISKELAVRFVSDDPPAALVNQMAATFLKKDGDIAAVLTTMFRSKEFWSPQVYRAKVKTPLEFMTSALRASGATVTNALPLVQAMNRLGMPVWGMQTPNGYGWTAEDWVSSNALISRMNFALVLSGGKVAGTATNWPGLLGGDSVASAGSEVELERVLLGAPATGRTRAAVMAEFGNPTAQAAAEKSFNGAPGLMPTKAGRGGRAETPLDTMAGLLLGSPEFQRR